MIPKGLFSQITIIVVAVLIVITYIKPELERTKSLQDKISVYKDEQKKVADVNTKLENLKADMDNVSESDKIRLLKYMPNTVDTIAVPRDITFITESTGVILKDVKSDGDTQAAVGEAVDVMSALPLTHSFSVDIEGSYEQIKQTLEAFEKNEYPLEVYDLKITKQEGGFLDATIKLNTYSRQIPIVAPVTSQEIVM